MGLNPIPPGQLATIVTSLEMRERPKAVPLPSSPFQLKRWDKPTAEAYRTLFRRVGAPWLWFSRLVMDDQKLLSIIHDGAIRIWAVLDRQGIEVGLLELDFRTSTQCEIGYFGLIPELNGKGVGRWLMAHCLAQAWTKDVERVWVHTCTLDHPSALGFYIKAGFTPYDRAIETFDDPRLIGLLPETSAPHIPVLR
jgi:GNAT superfamily N-acetyltransferase